MRVTEAMSYNDYWKDPRFSKKKPYLRGSKKQAFGDNIYFKDAAGKWHQADSHHSYDGGAPNKFNIENDTQTDRVLIGDDFAYWGGSGPAIPERFRNYEGIDICAVRNHKSRFPPDLLNDFIEWFHSLHDHGYLGAPLDW